MSRSRPRGVFAFALCIACGLWAAPTAQATFHEIKVREVFPGSGSDAYVELQAWSSGQNQLANHTLTTYNASGMSTDCTFALPNPTNGNSQATYLISDSAGPPADLSCPAMQISPSAGAVCWATDQAAPLDCMSWGTFSTPLGSPVGTPAASPPAGMALRRSIAAGNKNLLEPSDDTNNSAADFEVCPPNPRNSSAPIVEASCPGARGGTGSAGRPNTKIKKRPKNKSDDDSPTFKFKSTESGSKFKCKLDRTKYKRCKSPKTYHGLDPGKHTFKVKAIDSDGNADKSPAKDTFKVLR